MALIREETPVDRVAVRDVNERAFEQPEEADLVDALREACPEQLSLVAVVEGSVVGHALFTPTVLDSPGGAVRGMGLGPVAVLPEHQRRGIGSALVRAGIDALRRSRCPYVIVLGHADYYPRFGFVRASSRGIRSQWEGVPDEAFMVLVLDESAMAGASGVARYRPEFDAAM